MAPCGVAATSDKAVHEKRNVWHTFKGHGLVLVSKGQQHGLQTAGLCLQVGSGHADRLSLLEVCCAEVDVCEACEAAQLHGCAVPLLQLCVTAGTDRGACKQSGHDLCCTISPMLCMRALCTRAVGSSSSVQLLPAEAPAGAVEGPLLHEQPDACTGTAFPLSHRAVGYTSWVQRHLQAGWALHDRPNACSGVPLALDHRAFGSSQMPRAGTSWDVAVSTA